jgi:flavodoxin
MDDVLVMKLKTADEEDFKDRQLWVVGSPTRWGSATFGLRTLLKNAISYEGKGKRAAVFDTRFENMHRGAGEKLKLIFERSGIVLVHPPESFRVMSIKGPLADGEEVRAEEFGKRIAEKVRQLS